MSFSISKCSLRIVLIFMGSIRFLKDFIVVRTELCSTKLAQNERIVGLLGWRTDRAHLRENLDGLRGLNSLGNKGGAINQREIMIFLQDLLDALFSILMDGNMKEYDEDWYHIISPLFLFIECCQTL